MEPSIYLYIDVWNQNYQRVHVCIGIPVLGMPLDRKHILACVCFYVCMYSILIEELTKISCSKHDGME